MNDSLTIEPTELTEGVPYTIIEVLGCQTPPETDPIWNIEKHDYYTRMEVDAMVSRSRSRFGIEDDKGIMNRSLDMQDYRLSVTKAESITLKAEDPSIADNSLIYADQNYGSIAHFTNSASKITTLKADSTGASLIHSEGGTFINTITAGSTISFIQSAPGVQRIVSVPLPSQNAFTITSVNGQYADVSGNVIITAESTSIVTADNAIHTNVSNNLRWGGPLLEDTVITGNYEVSFSGLKSFEVNSNIDASILIGNPSDPLSYIAVQQSDIRLFCNDLLIRYPTGIIGEHTFLLSVNGLYADNAGNVTLPPSSLTNTQVAFGNVSNQISSSPNFTYDNTLNTLLLQGSSTQLKLGYDASNYATLTVSGAGNLTIGSTGTLTSITSALSLIGAFYTTVNAAQSNLWVTSGASAGSTTTANYLFAGASTVFMRAGIRGNVSPVLTAGASYASFILSQTAVTVAASGTHAVLAQQVIRPLSITTGAAAITNSASLYIEGASTGASNNYAIWVDNGTVRLDGDVLLPALATSDPALFLAVDSTGKLITKPVTGGGGAPVYLQIEVGTTLNPEGALFLANGSTSLVIKDTKIVSDSLSINNPAEVPRNRSDRFSYSTPVYTSTQVSITFNSPVGSGELFIIRYEKAS